jgi:hypothetical protein
VDADAEPRAGHALDGQLDEGGGPGVGSRPERALLVGLELNRQP